MYKVQREFDMLGLVVNYVCVCGEGGEEGGWGVGEVSYTCGRFFTYAAHHLYGTKLSTVLGDFEVLSVFKHNANLRRICLG